MSPRTKTRVTRISADLDELRKQNHNDICKKIGFPISIVKTDRLLVKDHNRMKIQLDRAGLIIEKPPWALPKEKPINKGRRKWKGNPY